jgi:uncharacterized protein YqgV (UPF0045/DUF77 family)
MKLESLTKAAQVEENKEGTKIETKQEIKEEQKKEPYWIIFSNEKDKTVDDIRYIFSNEDIENTVAALVKKGKRFIKTYEFKHFTVTLQTLIDAELGELNDIIQNIQELGDTRWQKTTREEAINNKQAKIQTEDQVKVHVDANRATRAAILAFYIKAINGEELGNSYEEKVNALQNYSPDLLDWIYAYVLNHFIGLRSEAIKRFQDF